MSVQNRFLVFQVILHLFDVIQTFLNALVNILQILRLAQKIRQRIVNQHDLERTYVVSFIYQREQIGYLFFLFVYFRALVVYLDIGLFYFQSYSFYVRLYHFDIELGLGRFVVEDSQFII